MPAKKTEKAVEMNFVQISRGHMTFHILGTSPYIYNAMSNKTVDQLMLGSQPKTRAEKATTVKHNPPEEYRNSVYARKLDETGPTRLVLPSKMFKASMREAALRMPGATKSEINQLVFVEGNDVDMYGIPQVIMCIMRSADMNRTPDVRTRAILPQWACKVNVNYIQPRLGAHAVALLLSSAGQLMGVGDSRPQKGYNYGMFEIVAEDDKRYLDVIKRTTMAKQDAALRTPVLFDVETERMWGVYHEHMSKRDKAPAAETTAKRGRKSKKNGHIEDAASIAAE